MFRQSGVVPYRIQDGKVEILLITSSKRKHWGIPKGWIEPRMTAADSAAKEAREEAGILGTVITPAVGAYEHRKWGFPCRVDVFLMQVETLLEQWAEANKRDRKWLNVSAAIKQVRQAELKRIFKELQDRA